MAGREFTVQAILEVFNVLKSYFWDLPNTELDRYAVRHIAADERPEDVPGIAPDHVLRFKYSSTRTRSKPCPGSPGQGFSFRAN